MSHKCSIRQNYEVQFIAGDCEQNIENEPKLRNSLVIGHAVILLFVFYLFVCCVRIAFGRLSRI